MVLSSGARVNIDVITLLCDTIPSYFVLSSGWMVIYLDLSSGWVIALSVWNSWCYHLAYNFFFAFFCYPLCRLTFRLISHSFPFMTFLSTLSCQSCPLLPVMFWPSCPHGHDQAYLSGRPLQTDLTWLPCPRCPVLAVLLRFFSVGRPVPVIPDLS
jgi:hypothetical protein